MASESAFQFGCARVDVTAPAGLRMAGYGGRSEGARGAHDALNATASVCQCGGVEIALCAVDVVGFSKEGSGEIRREVEARTGIPPERVLIATSHTHAGPVTTKFRDVEPDPDYMATAVDGIAAAVVRAKDKLTPAKMGFAETQAPDWHYNRRNEDLPVDDTLGVVRFQSLAGESLATWLNFGCHPTILGGDNLLFSRDWPGVACDALEAALAGTAMFLNGCHGDVGPHRPDRTFEQAEKVGQGVAEVGLRIARSVTWRAPDSIDGGSLTCHVPLDRLPTVDELREWASSKKGSWYEREWAQEQVELREAGVEPVAHADVEVQWFRIGALSVACFPGQMFGGWGIDMRKRFGDRPLLIVNQANAHDGYFPTHIGFERGGYEAWSAFKFNSDLPAPMTGAAGEMMIDAALGALS